jgi:hypothetical protein
MVLLLLLLIRPMLFHKLNLTSLLGRCVTSHAILILQLGPY